MILKVTHADGSTELLTLQGPLAVHEGSIMSHVADANGMDHYFNPDGTYDGWGRGGQMSAEEAETLLRQIQAARLIEPVSAKEPDR